MTATTLEIITPADDPVILIRRFVQAPPELVFDMWTKPEHLRRWLGPRDLEWTVCEIDLRVGGGYRWVQRSPDGTEHSFHGEFLEIEPSRRLVSTFIYDPWPDVESIDSVDFEAVDGGTLIRSSARHATFETRDQMVESGMEHGVREGYESLDELLAQLQSA